MKNRMKIIVPLFLISSSIALPLTLTSCATTKIWTSDDFKVDGFDLVDDKDKSYGNVEKNGLKNIDLQNGVISCWCHVQDQPGAYATSLNLMLVANPLKMMETYYQYYCHSNNKKPNEYQYIDFEKVSNYFEFRLIDFYTQDQHYSSKPFCKLFNPMWTLNQIKLQFSPVAEGNTSIAKVGDWANYEIIFKDPITHYEIFNRQIKIIVTEI